jgi:hypothetical protein
MIRLELWAANSKILCFDIYKQRRVGRRDEK